ncbi:MAG: hypothetical protein ACJ76J_11995 [Thermoanaerobaculia bacterium]
MGTPPFLCPVDLEMLRSVHELRLSGVELKAIEQAVFERRNES